MRWALPLGCFLAVSLFFGCGTIETDQEPVCGDGLVQGSEQCDGADLNQESCQSLGYPGGKLTCLSNCLFDTTGCGAGSQCGNGMVDPGEDCDEFDLNGFDCGALGYSAGTLRCRENCFFDKTGCTSENNFPVCGNGVLDPGEECDPYLVMEETCESMGYGSGDLYCSADLCDFYFGECSQPPCGNGVVDDDDEFCDGADLGGATCQHLGFGSGTLGCGESCNFYDISGCVCENEDSYEPNSLRDQARPVNLPFSETGLTLCRSFDADWFEVDLQTGVSYRFTAGFQHNQGDINLILFKQSDPYLSVGQATSENDNETFDYTVPAGEGGAYLLEIRRERLPIIGNESYSLNIARL